jgi:Ca-activated chloride channel family protein
VKRFQHVLRSARLALVAVAACGVAGASGAEAQAVRIAAKPAGLTSGTLQVPVVASEPVARLALFVNGVPRDSAAGREMTTALNVGLYLRRLRVRAVGYDAAGRVVGEDEMVVNDPRPPFRMRLQGPPSWPGSGEVELQASVLHPAEVRIGGVDFFVGEEKVATDVEPPYAVSVDSSRFPAAVYARAVARGGSRQANDVVFFGDSEHASAEVTVQQIPLSVVGGAGPLRAEALRIVDSGVARPIERLVPAGDQPLHVILLIDYSESMLEELPVVKAAARQFARALLRPQDRLAVVGFHQRTFWLTGYTNDWNRVAQAIDQVQPIGQTHLYDSVIQALYEIQKTPGRHALVVLTDGADQGSRFELDHLAHYARYAGVPVFPVIKNRALQRWMKLGVGRLQARRVARIAEDTGATYFIIQREAELAGVYARIAQELRQQYQLVFHSEAAMPDQWRTLKVVSADGRRLRAPKGYFP